MTGRERLLKALKREAVDRIPIAPFLYLNSVYELFDYKPNIDNFLRPPDFDPIEKTVDYNAYFGFDLIHNLGSVFDAYTMNKSWENWDVTVTDEGDGKARYRTYVIRTPAGELRQTENVRQTSTYLVVSAIDEYLIKTKKDFDLFRKFAPPSDNVDFSTLTRTKEVVGDRGIVNSCTHGAFNVLNMFRKLEYLMMDPVIDEGFYREMVDFFADWVIRQDLKMVEAGADVVEIGANLAGSGVGPAFFAKHVQPYEERIIDAIHNAGAFVIYHNCGDAAGIMHLYNEMDIDVWGYLTPPPFGDVDMDEALRVIRPDVVLRGNIDQVEFMMKATPQEVEARVRDLLLKVKARGNFILSTTDFFFDGTPYENIRAFVEAGHRYGVY